MVSCEHPCSDDVNRSARVHVTPAPRRCIVAALGRVGAAADLAGRDRSLARDDEQVADSDVAREPHPQAVGRRHGAQPRADGAPRRRAPDEPRLGDMPACPMRTAGVAALP